MLKNAHTLLMIDHYNHRIKEDTFMRWLSKTSRAMFVPIENIA